MGFQAVLDWEYLPYAVAGLAAIGTLPLALRIKGNLDRKSRRAAYPKDTVVVHQLGRGPWAPSMSPFCVKLETYLRVAEIPNQSVQSLEMSSKNKVPFIVYNGEEVADSHFCIEYLNEKLGIDLNAHLSEEERAIARAFQKLADEDLFWGVILWRYCYDPSDFMLREGTFANKWMPQRLVYKNLYGRLISNGAWGHGMGRHSKEQVMGIFRKNLQALSVFLGKKKYLMGDEPCEEDCAIFGQLAEVKWQMIGSDAEQWIENEFGNLSRYCERMKERFWPDWDECITHGLTTKPTK